ncbi:jg11700 [Pararge aegeria aegeria]|uniref:Jg11700 protein n=1 Tax=Pararge aegeria aegeria TaxID=348720 RepID=A0A8S4S1Y6_9NEOP|nr:jg11700 [Pararge aegeria aegeria]
MAEICAGVDRSTTPALRPPRLRKLKSSDDGGTDGGTPPANGSIFTMTLKNNHLIVETEERNDITKNGRETKMKYSPDNDGIFVVEVQQSTAYRPNNKTIHCSPHHDPQISTNQALIHRVPEELDSKIIIEEDSERSSGKFEKQALALSSTGLSISDLSMSSIGSHNVSYSYSSQIGYDQGPFGYPIYAGYDTSKDDIGDAIIHDNSQEPLIGKTPTDPDKPVVTAAIFKQDSIISNEVLKGPGYCIEGSTDGPLLSDVQAREYSLQHLHDHKEKKLENGVAVPITDRVDTKTFSRADSLPMTLEDESEVKVMETIAEDIPSKDHLKGKRASLPVITTDMYESVKEVIQTGAPKFEKFTNEMSPGESSFDSPPMITITEESESCKSDSTS